MSTMEWKDFVKVKKVMTKVTHPLMVKLFDNIWNNFKLQWKPKDITSSICAQDYLRDNLPILKKQAEDCLYVPYVPRGISIDVSAVHSNSEHMLEIINILESY